MAEFAFDHHRVAAARINHVPGFVEVREHDTAVPVQRARQRQVRPVHHPHRFVHIIAALLERNHSEVQAPTFLDRYVLSLARSFLFGFPSFQVRSFNALFVFGFLRFAFLLLAFLVRSFFVLTIRILALVLVLIFLLVGLLFGRRLLVLGLFVFALLVFGLLFLVRVGF